MKVYIVTTWQDNEDETGSGHEYVSHVYLHEEDAKKFCAKDNYSDYEEYEVEE